MSLPELLRVAAHEAENAAVLSLKEAFFAVNDQLKPPFPLSIPSPSEYNQLNDALVFGILTEPLDATIHIKHLHAIVVDGYELFTSILVKLCDDLYPKLLETPRVQLLWVCDQLVQVSAAKVDALLISLMRQISGANFGDSNMWLCAEVLKILSNNWDWLLEEPVVLTSALYVFLRFLADHYRLPGGANFDLLKRLEINFCIKILREYFGVCLQIGRDLVRILQDLVFIPEFKELWKDLLFHTDKFGVVQFLDLSYLYKKRTPAHYFLLRISPEMETQLRFLLTYVEWGNQKRYQAWFVKKHLILQGNETILADIVRFICCAHHPSNLILQSNVIARWAVIGWLLKCCRRNYFEANLKLALFYDWLFFNEKVDNIMNIEPAMLLMMNSLPNYFDITHMLLEFLFLLVDNYDIHRKELLARGVSTSFDLLVGKGVVHSLEPLTACSFLSPPLRERLGSFPREELRNTKASSNLCSQNIGTKGTSTVEDNGSTKC